MVMDLVVELAWTCCRCIDWQCRPEPSHTRDGQLHTEAAV